MYWSLPLIVILIVIALIYIFKSIKIVPESRVLIIEKLGKYDRSLSSGLSFLNPFFDRVARSVSLKEQVVDFPPQPVIDFKRYYQYENASVTGRCHRSLGNKSKPCGIKKYLAAS